MAVLYDDDFQSYALGQIPPYGNMQTYGASGDPVIDNTVGGIYGDSQAVNLSTTKSLQYPILPNITLAQALAGVTYTTLGVPAYSEFSVYQAVYLSPATDERAPILQFFSSRDPFFPAAGVAAIRILPDGTLAIIAPNTSAIALPVAVSDFSLLTGKWNFIRTDIRFSTSGGFVHVNCQVYANNQLVVTYNGTTTLAIGDVPAQYCNNIVFTGGGGTLFLGRTTIYDTVQASNFVPHAGSPVALVTQGVIELIKVPGAPPTLMIACPVGTTLDLGVPYDQFIPVSGGIPPYTFAVVAGALPPGITLETDTGEVHGAPTTPGTYPYTIRVTDSIAATANASCSFTVPSLPVSTCAPRFGPKIYFWEPSFLERPEDTFLRATDWDNLGYAGMKFIQGLLIEADTMGQDREIKIRVDQQDVETIPINHNGQLLVAYSLTTPYEGHMAQVIPVDPESWRLFNLRWVYEPAPEYVYEWKTQRTNHDIPGYQFLKCVYIAHRSTVDITLTINVDGVDFVYTIPNSGGVYKKTYMLLGIKTTGKCLKGKLFSYELRSTDVAIPFQLFARDSEVHAHAWSDGQYQVKQPFGDIHRVGGAKL